MKRKPCLRAAAAPPGCCLPCALDIAAASCLLCSSLSSLRLTGVPSGTRTKPPFPSGASPSGNPDGGPSPPSRLASFPLIDPSRPLSSDQCTIRAVFMSKERSEHGVPRCLGASQIIYCPCLFVSPVLSPHFSRFSLFFCVAHLCSFTPQLPQFSVTRG